MSLKYQRAALLPISLSSATTTANCAPTSAASETLKTKCSAVNTGLLSFTSRTNTSTIAKATNSLFMSKGLNTSTASWYLPCSSRSRPPTTTMSPREPDVTMSNLDWFASPSNRYASAALVPESASLAYRVATELPMCTLSSTETETKVWLRTGTLSSSSSTLTVSASVLLKDGMPSSLTSMDRVYC